MTDTDHMERVKALASSAMNWESQTECEVCTCPTCGVANARIRAELSKRGWPHSMTHRVSVKGNDFAGAETPYLAAVHVDGAQVFRIMSDLSEALAPDVIRDVEAALRRN